MKYELRDFFIPTERNGALPLSLTTRAFLLYLLVASILIVSPPYLKSLQLAIVSSPLSFGAKEIINLVNKERAETGLRTLKRNAKLDVIAAKKVQDMFRRNYFAHVSPQKKTPWDFLREGNYRYTAAGENLAIDFVTAGDAHKAFMDSPTHKANILGRLYKEMGAAVVKGTFDGRPTIIIAQYFGSPRLPSRLAQEPPKAPPVEEERNNLVEVAGASSETSASGTEKALGTSVIEKSIEKSDVLKESVVTTASFFENSPGVFLISVALIAVILISLFLQWSRIGGVPLNTLFRAIVVLTLLVYAGFGYGGGTPIPEVTPSAFSTIFI